MGDQSVLVANNFIIIRVKNLLLGDQVQFHCCTIVFDINENKIVFDQYLWLLVSCWALVQVCSNSRPYPGYAAVKVEYIKYLKLTKQHKI